MDSRPEQQVSTTAGPVRYRDVGEGEPLVFVHGVLADGNLWRKVVPLLAEDYRCIVPDWPLGSHHLPMDRDADLGPAGLTRIIVEALDALDLGPVTLVGNDTGGALCQLVAVGEPSRVARLVVTPSDAYENFPPRAIFWPLQAAAALPGGLYALLQLLRVRALHHLPFSFAGLMKKLDTDLTSSWCTPPRADGGVRRDLRKVIQGIDRRHTLAAAAHLGELTAPTLILWASGARFFPVEHANRLARDVPDATLEMIDDARAFVSEDQPERTAKAIRSFLQATPLPRR